MNKASTISLDLAKQVFQVHGAMLLAPLSFEAIARTGGCTLHLRRCKLRWKPALRIIGAVSFLRIPTKPAACTD
jgi:hypothetical protein